MCSSLMAWLAATFGHTLLTGGLTGTQASPTDLRSREPNCTASSISLTSLTIQQSRLFYDSSPTADEAGNSLVFQLHNTAIGVDGECSGHGVGAAMLTDQWFGCFMETSQPNISAGFQYKPEDNLLTVQETWVCDDGPNVTEQVVSRLWFADPSPTETD
jgi:hypothetical protein